MAFQMNDDPYLPSDVSFEVILASHIGLQAAQTIRLIRRGRHGQVRIVCSENKKETMMRFAAQARSL